LAKLISAVKEEGEPLDPVEIIQSEIIVPPEDLTFEEARRYSVARGLSKIEAIGKTEGSAVATTEAQEK
jgi:hypothetical protein